MYVIYVVYIVFLLISFKILYPFVVENFVDDKKDYWIILLTTCINPLHKNDETEMNSRKELYYQQINRWLNETPFSIVVVESSGYSFDEIKNDRLTVISFSTQVGSSTVGESLSILYALDKLKDTDIYKKCKYILKVTGRYFLSNITETLSHIESDKDLYLQKIRADSFQNSEYFGIKRDLMYPFLNSLQDGTLMETHLFNYSKDKDFAFMGPFPNDVPRGGDGNVIRELFTQINSWIHD